MQRVVDVLARGLDAHACGTSGAESLAAVANIFLGMVEAPLLVRPYLERMTALRAVLRDDDGHGDRRGLGDGGLRRRCSAAATTRATS